MAYHLYIEKCGGISLEDWVKAIEKCPITKIDESDLNLQNPKTGQIINVPGKPGDVAVKFKVGGMLGIGGNVVWEKAISFSNGKGVLRYSERLDSPSYPVRKAVSQIAKILKAEIVGEGDIEYFW